MRDAHENVPFGPIFDVKSEKWTLILAEMTVECCSDVKKGGGMA
jgi:hypothetical protein